jgi:hypothetical protein
MPLRQASALSKGTTTDQGIDPDLSRARARTVLEMHASSGPEPRARARTVAEIPALFIG